MALAKNIISQKKPLTEISQEEWEKWRASDEFKTWRRNWLERHDAKFDDKGRIIAYHGTTPKNAKLIKQTGFKDRSNFTLRPAYAAHWGRKVLEVHLPIDAVDFVASDMVSARPLSWEEVSDEPKTPLTEAYDLPSELAREAETVTKAAIGWLLSPLFRSRYLHLDTKEKQHDAVIEAIRKFPKIVKVFHEKAKPGSQKSFPMIILDYFSWESVKGNAHRITVTLTKDERGTTIVKTTPIKTDLDNYFWTYGDWSEPDKDDPELYYKPIVKQYEDAWEESKKFKDDYIYGFVSAFRTCEKFKDLREPYALQKNPLSKTGPKWKLDNGDPYVAAFVAKVEGKEFLFYFNIVKTYKDVKLKYPDYESGNPENPYVYMTLIQEHLADQRGLDMDYALKRVINTAKHEAIHIYQDVKKPGIQTGLPKEPLRHKHDPMLRGTTPGGMAAPGSPHIEKSDEFGRVVHAYRDVEFKSNLYNIIEDFKTVLGNNLPRNDWEKGFKLLIEDVSGEFHDWEKSKQFKTMFPQRFTWEISTAKRNLGQLYKNDRPKFRQYVKEIYKLLFISPRNV